VGRIFIPLTALAMLAATCNAFCDSTSVGISVTSDRKEDDLGVPQSAKVELSVAHTFDVGIILGGSMEYSDTAFSDSATLNVEATVGHRVHLNEVVSVLGSVGVGERVQVSGTGDDIAYYVLRAAADLKLNETVTWNAVALRYRDGFDPDDDYLTPQIATGLTFRLDEHNSVSTKVQYNTKDHEPDTVGFALGYSHGF
jgi:hypothetical protein